MAPSAEKNEAMLLCMTAMAMETKTLNLHRLAEIYSQLVGKTETYSSLEHRFRPFKKQAAALLEAMGPKTTAPSAPSTPKSSTTPSKAASKAGRSAKNTSDRVQTGRIVKTSMTSGPKRLSITALAGASGGEEDAAEDDSPITTDKSPAKAVKNPIKMEENDMD